MKRAIFALCLSVILAASAGCMPLGETVDSPASTQTALETAAPTTLPETLPPTTEAAEPTLPPLELTEEEQNMLLKIGMAELGHTECTECIALVMCTVLNRVESDRFSDTIYGVLHTPEQFTPVCDGSYDKAVPNDRCREALDMVIHGWDESQGALYYEFCSGESWHSRNLELLLQHCNTRFYK